MTWATMSNMFVGILGFSVANLYFWVIHSWKGTQVKSTYGFDRVLYRMGPMVAVINSLCRLYLVAKSFASLRNLPLGAYATTPWLQAITHL